MSDKKDIIAIENGEKELNEKLKEIDDEKIVFVDFWASWCGPCKMLGKTFENLVDEKDEAVVLKVRVDDNGSQDNKELAAKYGVKGIPHVEIFKGGDKKDTIVGAKPLKELKKIVDSF